MVHRQQPTTLKGYILIAHTSFYDNPNRGDIMPIKLRDTTAKVVMSVGLEVTSRSVEKSEQWLQGLPSKLVQLEEPKITRLSDGQGDFSQVEIPDHFPGGSLILLETSVDSKIPNDIEKLVKTIPDSVFGSLGWQELNIVLYRCDGEEHDVTRMYPLEGTTQIFGSSFVRYQSVEVSLSNVVLTRYLPLI
jgi:glycogen debranching enzyme